MFKEKNYPKQYASIKRNAFRLNKFLGKKEKEIIKIENQLWNFISDKATSTKPKKIFKNYKFLNAGWEWSVFFIKQKTSH